MKKIITINNDNNNKGFIESGKRGGGMGEAGRGKLGRDRTIASDEGMLGIDLSGAKNTQDLDEAIFQCLASDLVSGARV